MQTTIWASNGAPGGTCQHHRNALRRPRRALLLALAALLALGLIAGCGRAGGSPETKDNFTVTFATEPAAPVMGAGVVVLTLADPAGQPVTDAAVAIEANMSHAGMVPVNAEEVGGEGGVYRVPLEWTMRGDWYVDVQFTLADGQIVGRRFPAIVK